MASSGSQVQDIIKQKKAAAKLRDINKLKSKEKQKVATNEIDQRKQQHMRQRQNNQSGSKVAGLSKSDKSAEIGSNFTANTSNIQHNNSVQGVFSYKSSLIHKNNK